MEGAMFYWFAWLGWVWATFFLSRDNPYRLKIAFWLLLLMISSPYRIELLGIELQITAIILMGISLVELAILRNRIFYSVFLSSFIMMLAYVSFLLFELFDPVWVIFDRKWMIAIGGVLLASVLQSHKRLQVLSLGTGMLLGEIFFSFYMKKLSFTYAVASPVFLDALSLAGLVFSIWGVLSYVSELSADYINQGRGKQKSS
ncbi:hypothetical protein M3182_12165 [Mesobacillus maritimus]|mgnify:CR=1 FL=1|uniref:YphA family membrane protein n=1 Tax=Mesobacillus maritimus TaxID=1643336 RepID=UPI00203B99E0|nr:hypothetical protein [Mesobacillus maritimus]MCM3586489.1 hypothetical protein [Mesobacillus maritimus]MCM3669479.1 hypothetical protein [Mesobacillus maritimus]